MKQLLQDLLNGKTEVAEVPCPAATPGTVVISASRSLISSGTERMLVNFGKASLLDKARQQPEKVKDVLQKIRTDGVVATYEAVTSKLSQPLPLGYSNVGVVIDRANDVTEFQIGDRVVSNGPHAEVVKVPKNLVARIPDRVTDETASFTVLASIGLQGVRLAAPTLGEVFAVIGVGVIGLLAVQLLRANGCRVLAIDYDAKRLGIATALGAVACDLGKGDDPLVIASEITAGRGIDGVIIAAATKSEKPMEQAAKMSRKRGRLVLVGVAGLTLNRADFYEKELTFQVSCSYGPGRYDPVYESRGIDYPFGLVRWTEKRNFEAVLALMADGVLRTDALVSRTFDIENAGEAYDLLTTDPNALGILIRYNSDIAGRLQRTIAVPSGNVATMGAPAVVGVIGSGNFASRVLVPALKETNAALHTLASNGVTSAAVSARRNGFRFVASDSDAVLTNCEINTVFIVTRHDSHASLAAAALDEGKHVFVEKPLAIDRNGLQLVKASFENQRKERRDGAPQLMVGFNRRFSPLTVKMRSLLGGIDEPKSIVMTINAGSVPADHWTNDRDLGGGRIIGEACHFIDLMRFLVGHPVDGFQVIGLRQQGRVVEDNAAISLCFADGSVGTINYFSSGSKAFHKERIEVFCAGRVLQNNGFVELRGFGWPGFNKQRLWRQDKGHKAGVAAFVHAVASGAAAIPADELFEVAQVSIDIAESIRRR
jgi:predicted dehydrogenase/threonine dehydrogenase-like Zn-dependent dehydrogenase